MKQQIAKIKEIESLLKAEELKIEEKVLLKIYRLLKLIEQKQKENQNSLL